MSEDRGQKADDRRQMTEADDFGFTRLGILDLGFRIDELNVVDFIF
jgi:hypothetical protein